MHYADHVTKEWDNTIQLTHYLVNWKKKTWKPFKGIQIRWQEKEKKKTAEANEKNKGNCSYWNEKKQCHMTALAN